jgi:hypothetical protein
MEPMTMEAMSPAEVSFLLRLLGFGVVLVVFVWQEAQAFQDGFPIRHFLPVLVAEAEVVGLLVG